eukprot:Gregarina_sp_Poly_1__407@NODE_10_length_23460_cov_121_463087_g8_i1_p14_GENE_NODE_10_length_23460_cov_121_463087_g8_i1NODE_10_length_23460_cov_121_463087_g8_i1_p14_ORF_typecomplete_len189_score33_68Syntaphilin/PF15290_6/0_064PKcGMP_CC/PF16808_5/0_24_NODE_10_length_23460_cov_121_463087_g8_i11639116957
MRFCCSSAFIVSTLCDVSFTSAFARAERSFTSSDLNTWSFLQLETRLAGNDGQAMLQSGEQMAVDSNASPSMAPSIKQETAAVQSGGQTTLAGQKLTDMLANLDAAHPDEAESKIAADIVGSINAAEQQGAKKMVQHLEPKLIEKENKVKELETQLQGKSGAALRVRAYWIKENLHLVIFASLVSSYI